MKERLIDRERERDRERETERDRKLDRERDEGRKERERSKKRHQFSVFPKNCRELISETKFPRPNFPSRIVRGTKKSSRSRS